MKKNFKNLFFAFLMMFTLAFGFACGEKEEEKTPTPDVPTQPDVPTEPGVPTQPVEPTPEVPTQPDVPTQPVEPTPELPTQPDVPTQPVEPTPEVPVEPTDFILVVNGVEYEGGATITVEAFSDIKLEFKYLPTDQNVLKGLDISSSNETLLVVDNEGNMKTLDVGIAYIEVASIWAEIYKSYYFTIVPKYYAPEKIEIDDTYKTVEVNDILKLSAKVSPEGASQEVKWVSSDETIAVVDPISGVVSGKKTGKVVIKAISTDIATVIGELEIEVVAEVLADKSVVYVNKEYTDRGATVQINGKEYIIGKNATDNLIDAIRLVEENGVIKVAAGEYSEELNIDVNNISILGPNAGVNPARVNRDAEALISSKVNIGSGVTGVTIDGFEFSGTGAVNLGENSSNIAVQYCVFSKTSQDGVVRGPASGEVKNIKVNYNYSNAFSSNRFIHFSSVINGIELIGNEITCIGSFDFMNVQGMLKGTVKICDNVYANGKQSFIYVLSVGALDCTISGNKLTNIANTFIDLRDMKEDGDVKIEIFYNEFRDSFIDWQNAWMPIRVRAAGYDNNDSILVKVYDNKFINAGALDTDGVYYYLQNPGIAGFAEKWKKIYIVGKNYFEQNGKVFTDINNKHFLNSAISFETPYASEDEVPGFDNKDEILPTSIEITNKIDIIDAFTDYKVNFTIAPDNATNLKVGFSSSNTDVASISSAGVISSKSSGTCVITVYSLSDPSVKDTFTVEVAPKERIEIRYSGNSVICLNESLQLNASYHGTKLKDPSLVYISSNEKIATVDTNGKITAIAKGTFTITVKTGDLEANASFTVLESMEEYNELLQLLIEGNNGIVLQQNVMYIGSDDGSNDYEHLVYGSVNDYYTGEIPTVIRNMLSTTAENYDGRPMKSVEFIVFHDTAGAGSGSTAKANSGWCNNPSNTGGSWHYTIGNDGIYQQIEDNLIAWHAGDGISWAGDALSTTLYDTGIKADPDLRNRATATLGTDGYFYINGQKTLVKMPEGATVETGTNTLGIACVVKDGNYYIPTTHIGSDFGKVVCIRGGNLNGIGIESCVNSGSDVWLTWQYSAKFIAQLLLKYDLTPERVLFHNNFSNKPCPRTMMTADLVDEFLDLVYLEYYVAKNYSDYTITFTSNNPDILDNTGRIIKRPEFTTNVSYTITVTKDGVSQSITLNSLVLGLYN